MKRKKEEFLKQEQLKKLFSYDPATGIFVRVESICSRAKSGDVIRQKNDSGYIVVTISGAMYRVHRLAWLYMTGCWPDGQIDHINGVRDDNRWCNLRDVSARGNGQNQAMRSTNTSGVMGVSWHKTKGRWQALIMADFKAIHLGYYDSIDGAIQARKKALADHGFHENHGRE